MPKTEMNSGALRSAILALGIGRTFSKLRRTREFSYLRRGSKRGGGFERRTCSAGSKGSGKLPVGAGRNDWEDKLNNNTYEKTV